MTAPAGDPQGVLPGMPKRLYSASPSRLHAYLDCPRRYRFAYLDRPRPAAAPQRAHTSLGVAVHSALAKWWDLPHRERTPAAAARLVRESWVSAGFRDADQSERWRSRTAVETASYAERLDPDEQPRGIERSVALRTSTMVVNGRVDRLDERAVDAEADGASELVVVDYKTSRSVPGDDEARTSLPLAIYAAAVGAMFRRTCLRVELHHVPSGTVAGHVHTPESLSRKVAEAESIARELASVDRRHADGEVGDSAFPPSVGPLCAWCDYRALCPEGQAAGPAKSGWAALEP